jgi:hypothetical protein
MVASSKDIQKARQSAKRTRAAVACTRCKIQKLKCSDYRPCKRCLGSICGENCTNGPMTAGCTVASKHQVQNSGTSHQKGFAFHSADPQMRALPWPNTEYEIPYLYIGNHHRPSATYDSSVAQPGVESRDQQYEFFKLTTAYGVGSPSINFNASGMLQRQARLSQTEANANRYGQIVGPPADIGGSSRNVQTVLPPISSIYPILERQSPQLLAPFIQQGPSVLQPPHCGNYGTFLPDPADALHRLLALAAAAPRLQSCRTLPA